MGAPGNNADSNNAEESAGRRFEPRTLFAAGDERARLTAQLQERELRRAFDRVAKQALPDELTELLRRIEQSGNS